MLRSRSRAPLEPAFDRAQVTDALGQFREHPDGRFEMRVQLPLLRGEHHLDLALLELQFIAADQGVGLIHPVSPLGGLRQAQLIDQLVAVSRQLS